MRVLVYGGVGDGACDYYRLGMYVGYLAEVGIEVVPWQPQLRYPGEYGEDWRRALRDGKATVDLDALAAADVVLFSRWFNTSAHCSECGLDCRTAEGLERHGVSVGHASLGIDPLLRPLLGSLLADRSLRGRSGIIYDLDDDLLHQPDWVGHAAGLALELDVVELLVRSADLVTVSTPVLSQALAPYTKRSVVVRNAIELGLYGPVLASASEVGDEVRILFYGAGVRTREYELCRRAVDEAAASGPRVRRIWLGATDPAVRALVDEVYPYAQAGASFASALAGTRPDIGLAPLGSGDFERAKSELHWLEYSAVGAATIATRLAPSGPYDVIDDGVDGLLAETPDDWRRHVAGLAASSDRRAEIAGRARERIASDYSAARRAMEWAAVFRWAASHAGAGLAGI